MKSVSMRFGSADEKPLGQQPVLLRDQFLVEYVQSAALNIAAGGTDNITASAAKTGYTPIGVVGWSLPGSGSSYGLVFRCYLSGTTLNASIRSVNAAITSTFRWYVLYLKNPET